MKNKDKALQRQYDKMLAEVSNKWCWNCGRGEWDRPDWFYTPIGFLHRSHIVSSPRMEDRRLVLICCHLCHFGAIAGAKFNEWQRPRLTVAHQLWIKKKFDPDFFDLAFMQRYSAKILPRAAKPPVIFLREYAQRRGIAA